MKQNPETSEMNEAIVARAIREALAKHELQVTTVRFGRDISFELKEIDFWVWVHFIQQTNREAINVLGFTELKLEELIERVIQKCIDEEFITPKAASLWKVNV